MGSSHVVARVPARALVLAMALAAPVGAHPAGAVRHQPSADADSVVAFRLGDQFGGDHDAATFRGQAWLPVGAASGGRADATAWVEALRTLQRDPSGEPASRLVPVVAVADLRGVPRLLRRLVRGRFPRDPDRAVLLDWDGSLARRFALDGSRCTIMLVGPSGRLEARTLPTAVDTVLARALVQQATTAGPATPPSLGAPAAQRSTNGIWRSL
jgi:hypothetical protein